VHEPSDLGNVDLVIVVPDSDSVGNLVWIEESIITSTNAVKDLSGKGGVLALKLLENPGVPLGAFEKFLPEHASCISSLSPPRPLVVSC